MKKFCILKLLAVNCRIGSLEKKPDLSRVEYAVNCRIGSLENYAIAKDYAKNVNCRIGSLETLDGKGIKNENG